MLADKIKTYSGI